MAGAGGTWAAVVDLSTVPGEYVVTLEEITPSGEVRKGTEPVVILIPDRAGDPFVVKVAPEGVVVLQAPAPEAGITVDSVSYGTGDKTRISGRGTPGSEVSVFMRPISGSEFQLLFRTKVDADGQWSGTIKDEVPKDPIRSARCSAATRPLPVSRFPSFANDQIQMSRFVPTDRLLSGAATACGGSPGVCMGRASASI